MRLRVTDVLRFPDFDAAWAACGERLVPEGARTPEEALALYRRWYPGEVPLFLIEVT